MPNSHRPRLTFVIACLLGFVVCGCQTLTKPSQWKWRGEGYDSDVNALTGNLRPPADERQMSGIDSKARDIERNLGVR